MVKPHDKREPVNIQHLSNFGTRPGSNHYCGCPELLNDYIQLVDEGFVISRIIKVEVRVTKNKGYQPKLKAEADNPYRNLYYSGYHKN